MSDEMFTFEEETETSEKKAKDPAKSTLNIEPDNMKTENRGRPKKPETELIVRQTFLITEDIKKALKIKAITEGVALNDMVREILLDAIEPKYFENLD